MAKIQKNLQLSFVLVVCSHLTSCATDSQATRTQSSVIGGIFGAVVGGVLGGVAGKLQGHSDQQIKADIALGTTTGMAAGAVRGYQWGDAVARKKEQYARTEDYAIDSISDAKSMRIAAERENSRLQTVLSRASTTQAQLRSELNNGKINQQEYNKLNQALGREIAEAKQKSARIHQEIAIQEFARGQVSNDTSIGTRTDMDQQIQGLKQQSSALDSNIKNLVAVSSGGMARSNISTPQQQSASSRMPATSAANGVSRDANGTLFLATP